VVLRRDDNEPECDVKVREQSISAGR
jgi:hypothetical protein